MDVVRAALWKGCLGGLGLAVLFLVISGLTYLFLSQTSTPYNLVLLLSIASGPIIGTGGLLAILYFRALRAQRASAATDETTQRDSP